MVRVLVGRLVYALGSIVPASDGRVNLLFCMRMEDQEELGSNTHLAMKLTG